MTLLKVWLVHTCLAFPKHLEYSTSHHTSTAIYLRRLSAILWPISHRSKYKRTRMMVVVAWLLAPVCSLPQVRQISSSPPPSPDTVQCFVFRVRSHPLYPEYKQCTTIGTFQTPEKVRTAVLTLYFKQLYHVPWTRIR